MQHDWTVIFSCVHFENIYKSHEKRQVTEERRGYDCWKNCAADSIWTKEIKSTRIKGKLYEIHNL